MKLCPRCRSVVEGAEWRCAPCGWRARFVEGFPCLVETNESAAGAITSDQVGNLAVVDPGHFWYAGRSRLITWAIARYVPDARTLLEVGCGTGHVLGAMARARPELRLTGVEATVDGLRFAARSAPSAALVCADARHLPYQDEFDVVGAFDVLEHIPDDAGALRSIAQAARRGGAVILTVPQHPVLWSPLDSYSGHQRRYTRTSLIALAQDAGLEIARATSFVSLLLPVLLLSRLAQRYATVVPGREFDISSRINGIADGIMQMELGLIERGVSFPAGGSLLVIARRLL